MMSFGRCSRASARELVVVDPFVLPADAVRDDLVLAAREGERVAVREMAAVRKIHPQDRVARLERRQVHRHVGLRARVRLHVGMLRAEERLRAVDRDLLDPIHELAAAVVPLARITLRILVGEDRTLRLAHRARDPVLRGDELQVVVLAPLLLRDPVCDVGIHGLEVAVEKGLGRQEDASTVHLGAPFPAHPTTSSRYSLSQKLSVIPAMWSAIARESSGLGR